MTVEQLYEQLQARDRTIAELTETVGKLNGQVAWLSRQLFGRKSERFADPNQPGLFPEPDVEPDAASDAASAEPPKKIAVTRRAAGKRGKREPIPDNLRREIIVHDLPDDQKVDPVTGEPLLVKIGEEASEKLAFRPGEIYVEKHVRPKYRRLDTENLDGSIPEIVITPLPIEGLAKCRAAPSLLAEVGVCKFVDHIPLDRQVKIFNRLGVPLSKATMCRWIQGMGVLLVPLLILMKRRMIAHSRVIQHDDTPVRQQDPDARGRTKTCRFWTAVGQPGTSGHYVLFAYTQSRERAGPESWFRGEDGEPLFVEGMLQCDAYAGYQGLLKEGGPWRMTHIGCWAHARRKFHDARMTAPGQACHALGAIKGLYEIEKQVRDAGDAARLAARRERSAPRVDAFFAWCRTQSSQSLPRSGIGEALTYALNQEQSLRRYLDAGYLQIDNNSCERSLRGLAIGRKNWLFTGSPEGGQAAARLFSVLGSAQLHGLEPRAYLQDLVTRLPATPEDELDQFLPDVWTPPAT